MELLQRDTPAQLPERPAAKARARGVLLDTLTVSASAILAKVVGAAKAVVIARVFGSGVALDSYLLAFLVPSFLADVFCGSLLPALVPRMVEIEFREGRANLTAFYARALRRSVFLSLLGSMVFAAGAGVFVMLRPGDRLIGTLMLLMTPILPCAAVSNVWRALLNSQRSFAIPAVTFALTPAVMIICILLAGSSSGVWVLGTATALASVVEVVVLGLALRHAGFPILPRTDGASLPLTRIRREYFYLAATAAVAGGALFIGQSMAATLGPGRVSVFNYGTRLAGVLLAIGPAALSITLLPRFSQIVAESDWETLRRSLSRLLWGSALAAGALASVLIFFSSTIVRLTLEHGAFTPADTLAVGSVQAFSLLQMPFIVGSAILMRVITVLKANHILLVFSTAALVLNAALNLTLMNRYGVSGIALGASLAQALLFVALASAVFRQGHRWFSRSTN